MTTITYTVRDKGGKLGISSFTVALTDPAYNSNGKLYRDDKEIQLLVTPNPSSHYFNLRVTSKMSDQIAIRVFDEHGKKIEHMKGSVRQIYRFGEELGLGVYMVEVTQGDYKKVIRVIKQ